MFLKVGKVAVIHLSPQIAYNETFSVILPLYITKEDFKQSQGLKYRLLSSKV